MEGVKWKEWGRKEWGGECEGGSDGGDRGREGGSWSERG